jgi:hypothetical protein
MTEQRDDDPMTVLSGLVTDWFDVGVRDDVVRSFSEVNKRGLEAAGQLVARMTDLVDGATGHAAKYVARDDDAEPTQADSISGIRTEVLMFIDMWADMMTKLVDSSLDLLRENESPAPAKTLIIGPIHPGERTIQPLYAHSMLGQGLVRCRVGRLESARGEHLETGCVHVDPEIMIEGPDARTSVIVDIPETVVPDRYHGFVYADGVSAAAIPLEILITAAS